jgi:hypothetical protein
MDSLVFLPVLTLRRCGTTKRTLFAMVCGLSVGGWFGQEDFGFVGTWFISCIS